MLRQAPRDDAARLLAIEIAAAQGDPERATRELVELLRDAPGSAADRWHEQWSALHEAPHWSEVERVQGQIRVAVAEASRQGVPTVAWRGYQESATWTSLGQPGFYQHSSRRFLAVAPRERGYVGALVAPRQGVSLAIGMETERSHWTIRNASIRVRSLEFPFATIARHELRLENIGAFSFGLHVQPAQDAAIVEAVLAWSEPSPVLRIDTQGASPRSRLWRPQMPWLLVAPRGTHLIGVAPGYRAVDEELRTPQGTISLGPQHRGFRHSVDVHGNWAVVVSLVDGCDCRRDAALLAHRVSLVDLSNGSRTTLSHGTGAAAARFGGDGTLYVQREDRLFAYPPPYDASEEVQNVLLTVPRITDDGCCGW